MAGRAGWRGLSPVLSRRVVEVLGPHLPPRRLGRMDAVRRWRPVAGLPTACASSAGLLSRTAPTRAVHGRAAGMAMPDAQVLRSRGAVRVVLENPANEQNGAAAATGTRSLAPHA